MAEITITIKGRSYDIACDDGQEGRIVDLASYIDNKLQMISRSGSAYNEAHLMVLTSLVLADELFEIKEKGSVAQDSVSLKEAKSAKEADERQIAEMLNKVTNRIDSIAERLQKAS